MKSILSVRNILIAIPLLLITAALHYGLPQVDVVRAVGVEIKRMDSAEAQNQTRDVYFIQMESLEGDPRVYRNDDIWLYAKFDSADLQAQVQSFSADKQTVAVRHYGWRIPVFSMFPNAVKVWQVDEGYRHIPIFNIVVLAGLAIVALLVFMRIRKAVNQAQAALDNRRAERLERDAAEAREKEQAAAARLETDKKKDDDVDSFLNSSG